MKRFLLVLFFVFICSFLCVGQSPISISINLDDRLVSAQGLKKPSVNTQQSGVVVILIKVNQYGEVEKASIDKSKTTIKDKAVCDSALGAARNTRFSMSAKAPKRQRGTITYRFGDSLNPEASVTGQ